MKAGFYFALFAEGRSSYLEDMARSLWANHIKPHDRLPLLALEYAHADIVTVFYDEEDFE